jgi:hypothetical protein
MDDQLRALHETAGSAPLRHQGGRLRTGRKISKNCLPSGGAAEGYPSVMTFKSWSD